jgi:hypothetical protein
MLQWIETLVNMYRKPVPPELKRFNAFGMHHPGKPMQSKSAGLHLYPLSAVNDAYAMRLLPITAEAQAMIEQGQEVWQGHTLNSLRAMLEQYANAMHMLRHNLRLSARPMSKQGSNTDWPCMDTSIECAKFARAQACYYWHIGNGLNLPGFASNPLAQLFKP